MGSNNKEQREEKKQQQQQRRSGRDDDSVSWSEKFVIDQVPLLHKSCREFQAGLRFRISDSYE